MKKRYETRREFAILQTENDFIKHFESGFRFYAIDKMRGQEKSEMCVNQKNNDIYPKITPVTKAYEALTMDAKRCNANNFPILVVYEKSKRVRRNYRTIRLATSYKKDAFLNSIRQKMYHCRSIAKAIRSAIYDQRQNLFDEIAIEADLYKHERKMLVEHAPHGETINKAIRQVIYREIDARLGFNRLDNIERIMRKCAQFLSSVAATIEPIIKIAKSVMA